MTFKFWIKNCLKIQFFLWFTLQNVVFYTTGFFRLKGGSRQQRNKGCGRQLLTDRQADTYRNTDRDRNKDRRRESEEWNSSFWEVTTAARDTFLTSTDRSASVSGILTFQRKVRFRRSVQFQFQVLFSSKLLH